MSIIKFALKKSLLMNLLTVLIVGIGIVKIIEMQREAFPSVSFNYVNVTTYYPGASPKEVELYVTTPLEKEIDSVKGIEELTSISIESVSLIIIKLNADLPEAIKDKRVNDIQRAVDRVKDLPNDLPNPPVVREPDSKDLPVLEVVMFGNLPYSEIHKAADLLAEQIENLPDVAEVVKQGFREKEFWVEVSPTKMRELNVSFPLLVGALQRKNINLPGGSIFTKNGEYLVRTIGEITNKEDILNVVLRTNLAGVTVRVRDVATVKETYEKRERIYKTNGQESINLFIKKADTGDIINMVDKVKKISQDFRDEYPQQELQISYVNDMSKFVRNRLGILASNGYMGILLVLIALMLFLSPGIAFVTASGMPIAFMAALAVMGMMGMTINLLSMFALVIVLGMLVDDSIIVAENIWQHYEAGESPWDAAYKGTVEVFWPVTSTILTTIAAFLPLMMISGIFGRFIEQMPKVIIIALIASITEAMLILPSHAYDVLRFGEFLKKKRLLKKKVEPTKKTSREHKKTPMDTVIQSYVKILAVGLRFRWFCIFVLAVPLLAGSLWFAHKHMSLILFPGDGIETFYVRADLPVGSSLEETEEKFKGMEKLIVENIPKDELDDYVTMIGLQQDDAADPFTRRSSNVAQISVFLSPESERIRMADEIIESLRGIAQEYVDHNGMHNLSFSMQRMGPPVGKPVAIRVSGEDLDQMKVVVEQVKAELQRTPFVSDISDNFHAGKNELNIVIDEVAASKALLSVQDIALHIRTSYEGWIASYVRSGDERIAIRVRYPDSERFKIDSLNKLMIPNASSNLIKLSSVAKIESGPGLNAIYHRAKKRTITITAAIDESQTSSEKVNQSILPLLKSLEEAHPTMLLQAGGEWEDTTESLNSLWSAFVLAMGIVFLILATQFNSVTQPVVVMAAIPFGIVGVIWSFYFHGLPISFIGLIGAIGLSGIVTNDSIVLVDFINKSIEKGRTPFEACLQAGRRRFRAVWLTTLTTIVGLIPLVYGIGGMDKFLRPAAVSLGYGIIFGSVLVLFFIPCLYMIRVDIFQLLFGKEFWKPDPNSIASKLSKVDERGTL